MSDTNVLLVDGTTDGGCTLITPVPEEDTLQQCPDGSISYRTCTLTLGEKQDLPFTTMVAICGTVATGICLFGLLGAICVRQVQDDSWVFGVEKGKDQVQHCCKCLRCCRKKKA
eukprot:571331-Amphidinium_carterae.1